MPGRVEKRGNRWVTVWGTRTFHHAAGPLGERRAKAQLRLLGAVKHGWKPTKRR